MKTACIYHSRDLDGWMSAAIVKHWWKQNVGSDPNIEIEENLVSNTLISRLKVSNSIDESITFIGYDYGQPIPDLSEYDKVVMCDISLPKEMMELLFEKLDRNFIWNDHHVSALNDNKDIEDMVAGERGVSYAACELTWKYLYPDSPMPLIVYLLGRYDCFGHKGTPDEQKVLEFQYGARQCISNYEEAYAFLSNVIKYNDHEIERSISAQGSAIYKYLCTEAKQIYKRAFPIILQEPTYDVNLVGAGIAKCNFLCVNQDRFNPINFGIDYHEDGYDGFACFWLVNGRWSFSLYNDNGLVDCSIIAKGFYGGGHKGASGFVLEFDELDLIVKI